MQNQNIYPALEAEIPTYRPITAGQVHFRVCLRDSKMSKCTEKFLFTFFSALGPKKTHHELKSVGIKCAPVMVVRLSFILVFVSGVAVAFLCRFLPDISTLLGLTSSFDSSQRSAFNFKLSADEKYGMLGKGDIPSFHTSTLTIKRPQDLEIHPGKYSS